jgi:endogenous inhibitor of DNA gyrase (YacG/DUF329 family)
MIMLAKCPQCGTPVDLDKENPFKPFCSERCKLIDLGEWASEGYTIAGKPRLLTPDSGEDELPDN